jgi:hypothetical protein
MKSLLSWLAKNQLKVGDRVRLFGGYSHPPEWLNGKEAHHGACVAFIPGQNAQPAAVIELDAPASFQGSSGSFVVLELRYVGARWKRHETVHAELCSSAPENKPSKERKHGLWVESHASYQVV